MEARIVKVGRGIYNLEVDGEVRVREESFTVVSNVEEAMKGRSPGNTECDEVAEGIVREFNAYMGIA